MNNAVTLNAAETQSRIARLRQLEVDARQAYENGNLDLGNKLSREAAALKQNGGGPLVGMPCTYTIGTMPTRPSSLG